MNADIFVLGLEEQNLATLRDVPGAAEYRFHALLSHEELMQGEVPIAELLEKAGRQLTAFRGSIDAIVGYWDFPVSTMVPILSRQFGTRGPSLEAVVKCEHKFWSRLEQREVIEEYPRFALHDLDGPDRPPEGLRYPMWVKPVKSYSSELAFEVRDDAEYARAVQQVREGVERLGKPFEFVLRQLDLPPEVEAAGGQAALVEESMSGSQVTLEGFVRDGVVETYGAVDSVNYPDTPSFLRYQYPSSLPDGTLRRLEGIARRVVRRIGLDDSTFCIEFFCRPDRDGIRLLEINPRHSQSHAELFELVDGIPNHHCMLSLALGRDPHLPHRKGPYPLAAKWFLRRFRDGRVVHRATAEEIRAATRGIPGVQVVPVVEEGVRLSESGRSNDSYSYELAHVYAGAADERELREKYERCVAALDFRFDDGDGAGEGAGGDGAGAPGDEEEQPCAR